jgi:calcineurin-like phosphoesterase family protein
MGEDMIYSIISDIKQLADDLDYLYFYSDLMTKAEKLKEIEDIEKRISSILEEVKKCKQNYK